MKSLNKTVLILFVFYSIPRIAYGDDAQITELRNRIEYLEKKVETMNQTLIRMMAILDNSSSVSRIQSSSTGSGSQQSVTPNQLKWQDKQNWRKLRSGMSKDEVTDLLGEPDRIDKSTFFEDWRYGYRIITGSVRFSDNDKLDSWHEPQ